MERANQPKQFTMRDAWMCVCTKFHCSIVKIGISAWTKVVDNN